MTRVAGRGSGRRGRSGIVGPLAARWPRRTAQRSDLDEESEQLFGVDRLDQVAIETGLAGALLVALAAVARDRHHHGLRELRLAAQSAHHLVAVDAGEPDVEQDDVGPLLARQVAAGGPGVRHRDPVAD